MIRSVGLALGAFFIGAGFLVASYFIDILTVQSCWKAGVLASCATPHDLTKEVGFFAAVNWSIGLVVLFPLFVFSAGETYNQAQRALTQMVARGMLVTDNWEPASEADLLRVLRRQSLVMFIGLVAVLTIGGAFLARDFFDVVFSFYANPGQLNNFVLKSPQLEVDWSIAAPLCRQLTPGCPVGDLHYNANLAFAAAAYVYLTWFGAIAAVGFMLSVLIFAISFVSPDFRSRKLMLVPDVTSKDERRGFEVLESFFTYAIAGCFMLFAMGYLVTLQNVYLRTEYPSILQLVFPFLEPGAELGVDGAIHGIANAITGQIGVINGNIVAVTILGLLFFLIMLSALAITLRQTARRGQGVFTDALASQKKETKAAMAAYLARKGSSPRAAKEALTKFVFWPVRWLKVNRLFTWLAAATLSLLVVTVGAYLISVGIYFVLRSIYRRIDEGITGVDGSASAE